MTDATKHKIIYLICSGQYSSYGVDSVWSTLELAEAEIARMKKEEEEILAAGGYVSPYDRPCIAEWFLDGITGTSPLWRVTWDNDAVTAQHEPMIGRARFERYRGGIYLGTHHYHYHVQGDGSLYVHADSAEEAIKIASERRAEALAGMWGQPKGGFGFVPEPLTNP